MDKSGESTKRKKVSGSKRYLPQKLDRSHRIVKGLRTAQTITDPPALFSKRPKLRGSRAKGLRYEDLVGRRLTRWKERGELDGELRLGQWFSFQDLNGHGYCQTDILIVTSSLVFILECKLTYTDWAWPQLRELYKPIVEKTFERPSILVQVCRNLYYLPPNLIGSIQELMDQPLDGNLTWHFLGD